MTTIPTTLTVPVNQDLLAEKKRRAAALRDDFSSRGTLVVNLVSSPGAGKTSLLEATARYWQGSRRMAVLVGDLATERDAQRLRPYVPVEQLTTGGACHLELSLVERGLQRLPDDDYEFLFIENVGNLVCPASHDLAEHLRVVLLSSTEGDDKPGKYPKMFRTSQALVISKCDLLPYVPFSIEAAIADARLIQPEMQALSVCSITGVGIDEWCRFLDAARDRMLLRGSPVASGEWRVASGERGRGEKGKRTSAECGARSAEREIPRSPLRVPSPEFVHTPPPAHAPSTIASGLSTLDTRLTAARIVLQGGVQGVGVRPAIARLAAEIGLCGSVGNQLDGVEVHVEGSRSQLEEFMARLRTELPTGADVLQVTRTPAEVRSLTGIEIRTFASSGAVATMVPRDLAVCADCIKEVADRADRRSGYEFTSCTSCGPRYSIIETMSYERSQTSMRSFELCDECRSEYDASAVGGFKPDSSTADRRFHAQTNACAKCGPVVRCEMPPGGSVVHETDPIATAARMLIDGGIVAVKGIGGYQLLCDATNEAAVARLRRRKGRPSKPLPMMILPPATDDGFPAAIFAASNPIVLVPSCLVDGAAKSVHPGLNMAGVMLPTTPLHWLLLRECGRPLVVTSGNIEGEPLAFENDAATKSLVPKLELGNESIADLILHHDRRIVRPIDDSVVRPIGGRTVTIRAARGIAPLPLAIQTERSILAVGGHQKAAVALSTGRQCVLGPHIGDLDSLATRERFVSQTESLMKLYGCRPEIIVHDLHPDYFTTRWAAGQSTATMAVQHHHAHIVAGMLEQGWLDEISATVASGESSPRHSPLATRHSPRRVLGVAFDGTGYGTDGTVWGGEFLVASAIGFQRVAHLRPFSLPGGEAAVRQPWRVAFSLLAETLGADTAATLLRGVVEQDHLQSLAALLGSRRPGPMTTSAGRLFDGVAALLLSLAEASFEGEPAMRLEAVCDESAAGGYTLPIATLEERLESWDLRHEEASIPPSHFGRGAAGEGSCRKFALTPTPLPKGEGLLNLVHENSDLGLQASGQPAMSLDWRPMLAEIVADLRRGTTPGAMAMRFHRAMARAIAHVAGRFAGLPVVLSGGCFQNRILSELVDEELKHHPQPVGFPGVIPPNDGGLAAGQLAVAAARLAKQNQRRETSPCA